MKWAKFRIAATIFVALLILGVLVALLTGGHLFQPTDTVRVYMQDAVGMGPGTPVRLNGIPIGKIVDVRFTNSKNPQRAVVVIARVEHRYLEQISADSTVTVTSENIQGDKFLDITRGQQTAHLAPGGELKFQPAPDVLKTLDLAQFETRLRAIDAFLADVQAGKGSLGELLQKDELYRATVSKIAGLEKAMRAATSTRAALGRLLYTDTRYEETLASVQKLDRALSAIQRGEGKAGSLITDPAQYDRLRKSAAAMRQKLAAINAGTGGILHSDDLYVKWNRRLASLIASVEAFDAGEGPGGRLVTSAQAYESLNGSLREMRKSIADFRSDPHKYLRFKIF